MIRYNYIHDVTPPAPFVHCIIRRLDGISESHEVPAQLDTGANRTVVPVALANSLSLVNLGSIKVFGFDGVVTDAATAMVEIELRQLPAVRIEAILSAEEPDILLGRDVLNRFRVTVDGPKSVLQIE